MTELHAKREPIGKLFSDMQGKRFVIPYFQRPYSWDTEMCGILWEDITNFFWETWETKEKPEYFLGTIVSNKNEKGNLEIIDGQQRITTFSLIFRAFYCKLEEMVEDNDVRGLKTKIAPCIWDVDDVSGLVDDKELLRIESLVATEDDYNTFHTILKTGVVKDGAVDTYSKNYSYLTEACNEFAEKYPLHWQKLCVALLSRCIVLPIECASQETALTIFSTLNDRGMPLDDSDIFKAQIYRKIKTEEARSEFTENWKDLHQTCISAKMEIKDIFRYYTHIIRARKGLTDKEIGLRKFYSKDNYELLDDNKVMEDIIKLANFWHHIEDLWQVIEPEEGYHISLESRKFIHCLKEYPNEFWKYLVSVYFMRNHKKANFEKDFCDTLKKITAFMFAKFLISPTINAIKTDVYNACNAIEKGQNSWFDTKVAVTKDSFYVAKKLTKSLLLLHAYLNPSQKGLVSEKFQVEHILPRKWQNTNYNDWSYADAEKWMETFGNRVAIEKALNIQAGNNYFGKKKGRYEQSKIADVIDLSTLQSNDFTVDEIKKREAEFVNKILAFFAEQGVI